MAEKKMMMMINCHVLTTTLLMRGPREKYNCSMDTDGYIKYTVKNFTELKLD